MKLRGFALVEVAVASALGLLALTILVSALIPLLRTTRTSTSQGELSHLAQLTRLRISEDLQTATPEAIQLASADYFSVQPVDQASDSGHRLYASELLVYRINLAEGSLTRLRCSPPSQPVDHPATYTSLQLQGFFNNSQGQRKTLLRNRLQQFQLAPSQIQRPQLLRLQFLLQQGSLQYQCSEIIALRNGEL